MWTRNLSCLTLASPLASAPVSADDWWRREHASDPGTYLFVWDLSRATLGRDSPDHALRTYYRGLMFALIEGRALGTRAHAHRDSLVGSLYRDVTYLDHLSQRRGACAECRNHATRLRSQSLAGILCPFDGTARRRPLGQTARHARAYLVR